MRASVSSRAAAGSGFSSVGFIPRGNRPRRGIEQRDLRREQIAEQAGDAPRHIDARAADDRAGQHLDAEHAAGGMIPGRPAAHQRETLRDLLAAGAQGRAAPEVDHQRARHLAVALHIAADDLVGGEPAQIHRGRRRQGARVGGEHVAAGRHAHRAARDAASRRGPARCACRRARRSGAAFVVTLASSRIARRRACRRCAGRP